MFGLAVLRQLVRCKVRGFSGLLALYCDIYDIDRIPVSTVFPHPFGVVVGDVRLGERCVIMHGVTLGLRRHGVFAGYPVLGDDVFVGCGACVLGKVVVGDGVVIGANSVVLRDVPAGLVVCGVWK